VDFLTKEELVEKIKKSKCKMLDKYDVEKHTKEDIIKHLEKACCSVLKKLTM